MSVSPTPPGSFPRMAPAWWNALAAVLLGAWGVFVAVTAADRDRTCDGPA